MNISYNWLKEYVNFDLTPDETAAALTSIGLETGGVEEVQTIKGGLEGLVIGEVLTCTEHPNSDHLHICQVETAPGEVRQIVCGAPNVAAGEKVIVALPGCELEGGKISSGAIRGEKSDGMICSIAELGLDNRLLKEEDKAGIHVLPEDAPVGTEALSYLGLDDYLSLIHI